VNLNTTDQQLTSDCACLSVIIPVFNEATTLAAVVRKVVKTPHLREVIIIDDCSTDDTPNQISALQSEFSLVKSQRLEKNSGKTAALKAGFAISSGDIVIIQDADLEYDPVEIPAVIQPILENLADVVYGSRFLVRRATRVLYFYHYLANKFLTFFSNLFTNLNMTDIETGYKAFRGDIIRQMVIVSTRFGFEVEVTAKIAKLKLAIFEVPISYYGRTYAEGKKISTMDGVMAIWLIVRFNLFWSVRSSFRTPPS
jgi:glycosyltransferase involved in cell wall biosynthesis